MGRFAGRNGGRYMRAVVQRVTEASVTVENNTVGKIGNGFLVFLGVYDDDSEEDVKYLAEKITKLRVFEDENNKMNLSLSDISGKLLIVSQFTLCGDCRKGRRPSFDKAGNPKHAKELYEMFIHYCRELNFTVESGIFGADMKVSLLNDGPVTLLLDSKKCF